MPTIQIRGMSCPHCVMAVQKALETVEGVADIRIDLKRGEVRFTETKPVDPAVVRERVQKAGYEVV